MTNYSLLFHAFLDEIDASGYPGHPGAAEII